MLFASKANCLRVGLPHSIPQCKFCPILLRHILWDWRADGSRIIFHKTHNTLLPSVPQSNNFTVTGQEAVIFGNNNDRQTVCFCSYDPIYTSLAPLLIGSPHSIIPYTMVTPCVQCKSHHEILCCPTRNLVREACCLPVFIEAAVPISHKSFLSLIERK